MFFVHEISIKGSHQGTHPVVLYLVLPSFFCLPSSLLAFVNLQSSMNRVFKVIFIDFVQIFLGYFKKEFIQGTEGRL